jgi:hypothetical protein
MLGTGLRVLADSAQNAITPPEAASFGMISSESVPLGVDEHQAGATEPRPLSAIMPGSRRQPFHRMLSATGRIAVVTSGQ